MPAVDATALTPAGGSSAVRRRRWALRRLCLRRTRAPAPVRSTTAPERRRRSATRERIVYGDHDVAFADLWLPAGDDRCRSPSWSSSTAGSGASEFALDLMDGLAESLGGRRLRGVEHRVPPGRWRGRLSRDLPRRRRGRRPPRRRSGDDRLDLGRVAVVGHSAGGHLAGLGRQPRHVLPADAPGRRPGRPTRRRVPPGRRARPGRVRARTASAGSACPDLLGGAPAEVARALRRRPRRWRCCPIGVPVIAVHGTPRRHRPARRSPSATSTPPTDGRRPGRAGGRSTAPTTSTSSIPPRGLAGRPRPPARAHLS